MRTLLEIDYLLLVNDEARMGALRFADRPGGPFLAPTGQPPVQPRKIRRASLELALSVAEYFALEQQEAQQIAGGGFASAPPNSTARHTRSLTLISSLPAASPD